MMDREAWHAVVHGVTKNRIWLSTELNWIMIFKFVKLLFSEFDRKEWWSPFSMLMLVCVYMCVCVCVCDSVQVEKWKNNC